MTDAELLQYNIETYFPNTSSWYHSGRSLQERSWIHDSETFYAERVRRYNKNCNGNIFILQKIPNAVSIQGIPFETAVESCQDQDHFKSPCHLILYDRYSVAYCGDLYTWDNPLYYSMWFIVWSVLWDLPMHLWTNASIVFPVQQWSVMPIAIRDVLIGW